MASPKERVTEMKPYVERAFKDEDVREHLLAAFEAAKDVFDDLVSDRRPTVVATRVASDKDVQENLRKAVEEIRQAADRVQGKDQHTGRNTMLLLAGITLGILFNPVTGSQTRQWVRDRIFGPGDDFTFESGGTSGNGGTAPPQT